MPISRRDVAIIASLTTLSAFVLGPAAGAQTGDPPKQVLVLNSTRLDEQFSQIAEREVPKLLAAGLEEGIDYYTEYLDALRFPQPEYENLYRDFLRSKYQGKHFDLLILMGDLAIEFARNTRDVLFGNLPTMSYSINPPRSRLANSTGLTNELHFNGSIDLALALQPDLERIYVVSGAGAVDQQFERRARTEFAPFERRVAFTYLAGLATADLEQRLRTLPPHSAVYYVVVSQDGAGQHFQQMTYLSRVASVANAPTYSWADAAVETGIVGGRRRDHLGETKAIASLALRVLHGERVDDIPMSPTNTDVDQVDWRQLRRWGIGESRLPPGTRVLFREPTVWDQYERYIVGALVLMLAQTALIGGLLIQRAERRRAETQLRDSDENLRASYDQIRDLGRRLLEAQETERAHVARELHDDISQQLAVLSMDLDLLRSDPRPIDRTTRLSDALVKAQGLSMSVSELSYRLHPSRFELFGLIAAIDNLRGDFSRPGLSIAFSHRDVPAKIDQGVALCIFRVVQEALRNAVKHSGATHVVVDLVGGPAGVTLTITDDGMGFDVARAASNRLGLISMKERVESIGGTLDIQSTPGSGTRLTILVPIHAADPQRGS